MPDQLEAQFNALLTMEEVAKLLNVKRSHVYSLTRPACPKRLPVLRLGNMSIRFRRSDIDAWIEARLQDPPPVYRPRKQKKTAKGRKQ